MAQLDSIADTIIRALLDTKATLATAESCSGGLIGHCITNVAGASGCYAGGVIAYSNAVKMALLDVPESLLVTHGAVSEEVAAAMAQGARIRFSSDWAVAVTGIAGPGGGTEEKPVGLVYIGVAGPERYWVTRNLFEGDRESVKTQTAQTALALLGEKLLVL